MSEVEVLAGIVRAGLDRAQADAERHACALDCLAHISQDWHRIRNEGKRRSARDALRSVGLDALGQDWPGMPEGPERGIHYDGMRGTAMDPARVLARVGAMRGLLDAILAEKHEVSDNAFYTCRAATVEHDGDEYGDGNQPGPCDCGRDARVLGLLRHLANAYPTTQEGQ